MPFIGKQPEVGAYSVLDALTASATANYSLQLNGAAFVPNSVNQLLVSLNGVIQKPGSSFVVSGSTLTFKNGGSDQALTSSDSIDFIISMGGDPLNVGIVSDGTVSNSKITGMAASKLSGALPAIDGSALTGVGLIKTADIEPSGTTAANFTSIPAGVNHIQVSGVGLSIASGSGVPNSYYVMRIGSNNTLETSGYTGSFMQQNSAGTDGIASNIAAGSPGVSGNSWPLSKATNASSVLNINADLRLIDSDAHVWGYSFISSTDGTTVILGAGQKTLSARLDRLRVYTYSGYTFDAGKISIQYE